ncbi:MAG: hypothetical protein CL455_00660 [Acidimicrobiaceae bacterium]|nr:hypothetical protein [Acidimicrobiaceae bacterium]
MVSSSASGSSPAKILFKSSSAFNQTALAASFSSLGRLGFFSASCKAFTASAFRFSAFLTTASSFSLLFCFSSSALNNSSATSNSLSLL